MYDRDMRIYIPLTVTDLDADLISSRSVHAVTPQLREYFPHEDQEGLEMVATLAAADDSLRLMTIDSQNHRRIVAVAEIVDKNIDAPSQGEDALATQQNLNEGVPWKKVEALLIDEPGAEKLVVAALAGNEDAFLASGDIELMWYDVVERADVARMLRQ